MRKLIYADELMQRCYQELEECTGEDFKEGIRWMMVDVVELPAVDAVPVVRCKDCMYKDVLPDMYGIGTEALYCPEIEHYVEHDFFCKYGEKVMTNEKENISRDGSLFLHNCFSD